MKILLMLIKTGNQRRKLRNIRNRMLTREVNSELYLQTSSSEKNSDRLKVLQTPSLDANYFRKFDLKAVSDQTTLQRIIRSAESNYLICLK